MMTVPPECRHAARGGSQSGHQSAASILPVLGPQHDIVQHVRALPHRDVAVQWAKTDTTAYVWTSRDAHEA